MSKANVQHDSASGTAGGKLPEFLSNLKPNSHLLHLTVLRQLSNQRAGTASTKTRTEVRGGGKKPWKQKGTGRARVGSIRSPLWVGGGITFGPKPRSYEIHLPKKVRRAAIAQALAVRAKETIVLKGLTDNKNSKTKEFVKWLESANLIKKPILIVASPEEKFYKEVQIASRNISDVNVEDCNFVGVYDLLKAKTLAITEAAFQNFENKFSKKEKEKKEKGKTKKIK